MIGREVADTKLAADTAQMRARLVPTGYEDLGDGAAYEFGYSSGCASVGTWSSYKSCCGVTVVGYFPDFQCRTIVMSVDFLDPDKVVVDGWHQPVASGVTATVGTQADDVAFARVTDLECAP